MEGLKAPRRPQYRVLAGLLRRTTAELLIRGLDERGITIRGIERRRDRLVKKVLVIITRLNAHEAHRRARQQQAARRE